MDSFNRWGFIPCSDSTRYVAISIDKLSIFCAIVFTMLGNKFILFCILSFGVDIEHSSGVMLSKDGLLWNCAFLGGFFHRW